MFVIQSKKPDYNRKIYEIENKITTNHDHDKYITTQEFNKLAAEMFTARLGQDIQQAQMILLISLKRQFLIVN